MDLNHPARSMLGPNRARVLHVLATLAEPATGRRIFELSQNASLGTTQGILDDLVRVGLVHMRRIGPAHSYTLNRNHLLWGPIEQILATPARLEEWLIETLDEILGDLPRSVALFGSFARGEAGDESDLDLLVVWGTSAPDNLDVLLDEIETRVTRATGNSAHVITLTTPELEQLVSSDDPLAASFRREARTLSGDDLSPLIGRRT